MSRPHFLIVSASPLFLPMLDATLKGTGVLLLACAVCLVLRRDSAATRHLVWATAILLVLAMPLLCLLLPQWRVLPPWPPASLGVASSSRSSPELVASAQYATELPHASHFREHDADRPSQIVQPRITAPPQVGTRPTLPHETDFHATSGRLATIAEQPTALLTAGWLVGCALLLLRLLVAVRLLRKSARRCRVVAPLRLGNVSPSNDRCGGERALRAAMDAAAGRLGINRSVQLLLDSQPSMPVVWGLLRPRLRLPTEAVDWSMEQQQSVLLHELAHIRRGDLVILVLTQFTCALNWFNPLVWFAAWRLHVERERACDDLVLRAGVRPSTYAGHLVEVVSRLRPAAWTTSCGLAMARKSSLESRLLAVLSARLNRRGVSRVLTAAAIILGAAVAIPVAMLRAADAQPKHEYAQSLFRKWQASARTDGKIPGALIGHVAREVDSFLKQYPADKKSPQLAALRPRLGSSHDWTQAEVVALLDDITDISTAPVSWAGTPQEFQEMRMLRPGAPLPAELTNAAWGKPLANGLRAAWLLEPRAEQYAFGSVLKTRVLFHNSGQAPVVFMTETWHQEDKHSARTADGKEIPVNATWYSGITPLATYRLAPGEYCEVPGHGLAIGAGEYVEEHSTGAVGAIIEAKVGDDVLLSHSVDVAQGGWTRPGDPQEPAELWKRVVAERVANEGPLPSAVADREQLIRRVTFDLFGEPATAEEVAAFTADHAPDALANLAARLQAKPRIQPWAGKLPTGEKKFRVIAADPNAAKAPRTANSPGQYVLGEHVHLLVSQTTTDSQRTNKAVIAFLSPDPKVASPHPPYEIGLPDGIATYGIVWERGAGVLWILQKDLVRKYDFTSPAQVKEVRIEPGSILNVPEHLRDAMRKAFHMPGAPAQQQKSQPPQGGAKLEPAREEKLQWGQPVNGLRAAIAIRSAPGEAKASLRPDLYVVVQNVSEAPIRLNDTLAEQQPRMLYIKIDGKIQAGIGAKDPRLGDVLLQPREVAFAPMYSLEPLADGHSTGAIIAEGALRDGHHTLVAEVLIERAPAKAWAGKLVTGETSGAVAAGQPQPQGKDAQALFRVWQAGARTNGRIPGGTLGRLARVAANFIKLNPTDERAPKLAELFKRIDTAHDWTPAEAVALLDEVTGIYASLPSWVKDEKRFTLGGAVETGQRLPAELEHAPWGRTAPNGLEMAWLLDPRAEQYRLGTPLKSRILFHNAGTGTVVFRALTWNQPGPLQARDAQGTEISIASVEWTTIGRVVACRLAPGEFVEMTGAGIGIGAEKDEEDWRGTRVGDWIEAKAARAIEEMGTVGNVRFEPVSGGMIRTAVVWIGELLGEDLSGDTTGVHHGALQCDADLFSFITAAR
ncbi:MAG: DUF1549 domain-containing protein [Planctomycetota bacterium]|nr:DUF1549 domain-containing protein [Planctomycetota bacterium]